MKLTVDISEAQIRRIRQAMEMGSYASIASFLFVAIENQLALELEFGSNGDSVSPQMVRAEKEELPARESIVENPSVISFAPCPVVNLHVRDNGWLWGIVNRVFPIKIALRSLAKDSVDGPPDLATARANASQRAEYIATKLEERRLANKRTAPDLTVGLPVREPLSQARERYANHFFGRLDGTGNPWGALFELGLAGLDMRSPERALVGLTEAGAALADLSNPVLDQNRADCSLSDAEVECYVAEVASIVPREKDSFVTLLGALRGREATVEMLDKVAASHLPSASTAAIQTQKAGALGRLQDLRLVERRKIGRTARYRATQLGDRVLATLLAEK